MTAREACSAANKAAKDKIVKYGALSASHIFLPVAVETAGVWNKSAIELIQEIGRRISAVTVDSTEMVFLFQRLSIGLQRGNAVAFLAPFDAMWYPVWSLFLLSLIFMPAALCWWANKNNNNHNNQY